MQYILDQYYGIREATVTPIPFGIVNQNAQVQTASAAYVLKRYTPGLFPPERIQWSSGIQAELGSRGLPVAPVIPNLQGELVTTAGETVYVLYGLMPGRHHKRGELPNQAARSLGRTLATSSWRWPRCSQSTPTRCPTRWSDRIT